jgi:hypothetical protein
MKTIQTTAVVGADHLLTVQVPEDVSPGEHRVFLTIEEPRPAEPRQPWRFSGYPAGLASDAFTCRREDLYGNDGR